MQITAGTVELTGLDRGRDAIAIRVGVDAPLRTVLTLLKPPHLNLLADLSLDPATTDGQSTSQLGLAVASLAGLLNTLHSDGLAFAHLMSDFTLTDRVVTMRQLRTYGGALGLTVVGSVDLHASRADLKGTIIPLYKVNTVVGKIPIVGDRLLGGTGQGLVAMTAHVTGRLPDPQVRVNPASVVTPGFLRGFSDLFEGNDKTDSEQRPRQE